jgi:hypothetical protein
MKGVIASLYRLIKERKIKKNNYILKCPLNSVSKIEKKIFSKSKEKSFKLDLASSTKLGNYHSHFHDHGQGQYNVGPYYFWGKSVGRNWSNLSCSVDISTSRGIISKVNDINNDCKIILTRPNEEAYRLSKNYNNLDGILSFIKTEPESSYYVKPAIDILQSLLVLPDQYASAIKSLPLLKSKLEAKILASCTSGNKSFCSVYLQEYKSSTNSFLAQRSLDKIVADEKLNELNVSTIEVLESKRFKSNDIKNINIGQGSQIGRFFFNELLVDKGNLQYLISANIVNKTKHTMTFIAKVNITVTQKRNVNLLGYKSTTALRETKLSEDVLVLDLKPGERRYVSALFDLGLHDVEKNTNVTAIDSKEFFEVTDKSIKMNPLRSTTRKIESMLLHNIKVEKIAEINLGSNYNVTLRNLGLSSSSTYREIKQKVYKKSFESSLEVPKMEGDIASAKKFEGVWKGKLNYRGVASLNIEMALEPLDGNNVDIYIKYSLNDCLCPSLYPMKGETFYDETNGTYDGKNLKFKIRQPTVDKYRIWTALSTCNTLDKNKGSLPNDKIEIIEEEIIVEIFNNDKILGNQDIYLSKKPGDIVNTYISDYIKSMNEDRLKFDQAFLKVHKTIITKDALVVGIYVLQREESHLPATLRALKNPLTNVSLVQNGMSYKLKYYSGITINNSEYSYPYYKTNNVNCTQCGAYYRYFELYFPPLPSYNARSEIRIADINFKTDPFIPSEISNEYYNISDVKISKEYGGYNMYEKQFYQEKKPNCKCFHPVTQEFLDVWHSSTLTCKNGLIDGKEGIVNFANSGVYSTNWLYGKANGITSIQQRMHPLEYPRILETSKTKFVNNVIETYNDKTLGWQFETLFKSYVETYVAITGELPKVSRSEAEVDCGCEITSIKDEGWLLKNGFNTVKFKNGYEEDIKYEFGKWRIIGWIYDDTFKTYKELQDRIYKDCKRIYCKR